MPFTFAHPAAVIPLYRPLARYGVLSALIIGSVTPDIVYFIPLQVSGIASHSLAGLFWFCIPAGVAFYLIFHTFLKCPLLCLLPAFVLARLGSCVPSSSLLPITSWVAVIISLFIGAITHIAWDAFTHSGAPGVEALPTLNTYLFSLFGYHVYLYKLLQHTSTVLGLGMLFWWTSRWLQSAPVQSVQLPVSLSVRTRTWLVWLLLGAATGGGLWSAMQTLSASSGLPAIQAFVGGAIFAGISALGISVLIYSLIWHAWVLFKCRLV